LQNKSILIEHDKNISSGILNMIKDIFKKVANETTYTTFAEYGVQEKKNYDANVGVII